MESESRLKKKEEGLLRTRLCDLHLDLEKSLLAPLIDQVCRELRHKGILFRPYFWISDEWFCPEGYTGVAVPFFLLEPDLRRLEKQKMGFVDGKNSQEILKILRHEVGHALEHAFLLKNHPLRVNLFGNSRNPYPVSYRPRPYSKAYVKHLGWGYGQCHPDEDFAETFAVWLEPRSQWKLKYRGTSAYKKLLGMSRLMAGIRGLVPLKNSKGCFEPLSRKKITLAEYYRRKQMRFRLPLREKLVAQTLPSLPNFRNSHWGLYFQEQEKTFVKEVSTYLGQPRHLVRRVIMDFIRQGSKHPLPQLSSSELRKKALDSVTEASLIYLEKGLDRVVL